MIDGIISNVIENIVREFRHMDSREVPRCVFHQLLARISEETGIKLPFVVDCSGVKVSSSVKEYLGKLASQVIRNPDVIDDVYNALIPRRLRREHGQFLTPPRIAEFMVRWGLSGGGNRRVLDLGVGTGVFLSKAFSLLKGVGDFHLVGIDVDPLLLNACFIRLKLLGVPDERLQLINADFITWESRDKYDFVVSNPPYIKFHGFDRSMVSKVAHEFNIQITKLTNVYTLFFIRAAKFVREGGRVAFITPSEFLYTGYGEVLKRFLLENYRIVAFILAGLEEMVFEDVMTTGLITLLERGKPESDHRVKFGRLGDRELPKSLDDLEGIMEVPQNQLDPRRKWLTYFLKGSVDSDVLGKLVPLSAIASVDRGIATGYNEFFTLSEDTARRFSIPKQYLKPVISKASHCPYYDFTSEDWEELRRRGERVYLLYILSDNPPESLKPYLYYGVKLGVHRRYIPSHRRRWYMVDKREPSPILALVFSRERLRFVYNKAGVLNLTPFHCVYPRFRDELKLKALLAYLNSNICKEIATYYGRIYGTGLRKLEPGDLENLPVIDVRNLDHEDLRILASLFDELCEVSRRNPEKEEDVKKKIDNAIKDILARIRAKRQEGLSKFIG